METIEDLSRRLKRGDVSPVDLARACLERIRSDDPTLRAFIEVDAGAAIEAARNAQREIADGDWRGPLHGIPYAVKDLCDVRGMCTTGGSRLLPRDVAAHDSAVVARMRAAGAVLIGKTNLHELAFGPLGTNPHFGDTRNPWDTARHSGGSSGGSAAAVAAGMSVFAIGSDTTGSIRIPASFCGVVGLKPTFGSVDAAGSLPLAWSLDHFGPIARCVGDAAVVYRTLAGLPAGAEGDACVPRRPLRVGVLRDFADDADPAVAECFEDAVSVLTGLGCAVSDVRLQEPSLIGPVAAAIVHVEALAAHGPRIRANPAALAADVRERFELAELISGVEYVNAQRVRRRLAEDIARALTGRHVLICPTEPIAPPMIDEALVSTRAGAQPKASVVTRFTRLFNLTGHPAITLPCGFDRAGLPVGLQIAARHGDEATLLGVASLFERATQWHLKRPSRLAPAGPQ